MTTYAYTETTNLGDRLPVLGITEPPSDEAMDAARRVLAQWDAMDLAEMLGLS